jgi:hypothetical protein
MQVVPLQPVPAQVISVVLGNQPCKINVYQKRTGLYVDLYILDALVVAGVSALNANLIVRSAYLGFVGDLAFFDTLGSSDPVSTGLGAQYILMYLSPADL